MACDSRAQLLEEFRHRLKSVDVPVGPTPAHGQRVKAQMRAGLHDNRIGRQELRDVGEGNHAWRLHKITLALVNDPRDQVLHGQALITGAPRPESPGWHGPRSGSPLPSGPSKTAGTCP